jgi:hypothetical protein
VVKRNAANVRRHVHGDGIDSPATADAYPAAKRCAAFSDAPLLDGIARRTKGDIDAVADELPAIYRDRYESLGFLKDWSVTVAVVGWKLAQAAPMPLSNVGMGDLRFKNWFSPFGSGVDRGVPHPFVLDS